MELHDQELLAHRVHPNLIETPLVASGLGDVEVVMEDFYFLPGAGQRRLPMFPQRKLFVGSARVENSRESFERSRDPILLLMTLYALVIRPHYLTESSD